MKQFEFLIKQMQMCHLTDEQWNNCKAILYCHKDGFTDCYKLSDLLSEIRLNNEQFSIFVDMLDTSRQKLEFLHAGGEEQENLCHM
jgi:hypothetical protein